MNIIASNQCTTNENKHRLTLKDARELFARADALANLPLTPTVSAVLQHLLDRQQYHLPLCDPGQTRCYPTVAIIAQAVKRSPGIARKAIRQLENAGIVEVIEQRAGNGRQWNNRFRFAEVLELEWQVYRLKKRLKKWGTTARVAASLQEELNQAQATLTAHLEKSRTIIRPPRTSVVYGMEGYLAKRVTACERALLKTIDDPMRIFLLQEVEKLRSDLAHHVEKISPRLPKEQLVLAGEATPEKTPKNEVFSLSDERGGLSVSASPLPLHTTGNPNIYIPPLSNDTRGDVMSTLPHEEEVNKFFIFCRDAFEIYLTTAQQTAFLRRAEQHQLTLEKLSKIAYTFARSPYLRATTQSLNRLFDHKAAFAADASRKATLRKSVLQYGLNPLENPSVTAWDTSAELLFSWLGVLPVSQQKEVSSSSEEIHPTLGDSPAPTAENSPVVSNGLEDVAPTAENSSPVVNDVNEILAFPPHPGRVDVGGRESRRSEGAGIARRRVSHQRAGTSAMKHAKGKQQTYHNHVTKEGAKSAREGDLCGTSAWTRKEYISAIGELARKRGEKFYFSFFREVYLGLHTMAEVVKVYEELRGIGREVA